MPHFRIDPSVTEKLPKLSFNEDTFDAIAGTMRLGHVATDNLEVVITETLPERRKRLMSGVGRFAHFGHPTGGFYGRDNQIRVYRRGAPTPEDMSESIIRGLAAASTQQGVDYEQTDKAQRLQYKYLAAHAMSGLAIGNIPTLVHATAGEGDYLSDWLFRGSVLGFTLGSMVGIFRGSMAAMDRYPQAGSGGLGYYIAEGVFEHASEVYRNEFEASAPLITAS